MCQRLTSNPCDHYVTNVQSNYDHAMVSTLVISQHRCGDDDDFVSYLIKVWIITKSLCEALDTTVYNPRQLGGGGVFNWGEILWGWSLSECFVSSSVLLYPHSMSGRWHRHLTWSCEPQENTLPATIKSLPHGPSTLALEQPAQLTREELRLFTF